MQREQEYAQLLEALFDLRKAIVGHPAPSSDPVPLFSKFIRHVASIRHLATGTDVPGANARLH